MNAPRTTGREAPRAWGACCWTSLGLSSNDALQKAKWLLRAEKAGHTGTLDPLATGVLPLCFGAATKFSQLQLDADKDLRSQLQSPGRDHNHCRCRRRCGAASHVDPAQHSPQSRPGAVQLQFSGDIRQVPPMHSALKKDGKALYEYARARVIEVERAAA
jgi:tRNA pseudouridine55 synthase